MNTTEKIVVRRNTKGITATVTLKRGDHSVTWVETGFASTVETTVKEALVAAHAALNSMLKAVTP